jgi:biofilm protein TabA
MLIVTSSCRDVYQRPATRLKNEEKFAIERRMTMRRVSGDFLHLGTGERLQGHRIIMRCSDMILDTLDNAPKYFALGERIAAALRFLQDTDLSKLESSAKGSENSLRVPIRGEDEIFALVQRYNPKRREDGFFEAHRKYIDVQYVVEGNEAMDHAPLSLMREKTPYDAKKDFAMYVPDVTLPSTVHVGAGMFAIFMPHDVHMPGIAVKGLPGAGEVKKVVVKVSV